MSKKETSLLKLRDQISAIDEQLHALLIERAEIAAAIGEEKKVSGGGLALRPAREAEILRRLVESHQGALPVRVLVRIWREIMSAMAYLQSPFRIEVFGGDDAMAYRDIARAHFGSYVTVSNRDSATQVLAAVQNGDDVLGVLPIPDNDREKPWWTQLIGSDESMPRIIARIPAFFRDGERALGAYVVGRIGREPSGADMTLAIFGSEGEISRGRIGDWLAAQGLKARAVAIADDGGDGRFMLLAIHDYIAADDTRLAQLLEEHGESLRSIHIIGGYPAPIVLEAAAGS